MMQLAVAILHPNFTKSSAKKRTAYKLSPGRQIIRGKKNHVLLLMSIVTAAGWEYRHTSLFTMWLYGDAPPHPHRFLSASTGRESLTRCCLTLDLTSSDLSYLPLPFRRHCNIPFTEIKFQIHKHLKAGNKMERSTVTSFCWVFECLIAMQNFVHMKYRRCTSPFGNLK